MPGICLVLLLFTASPHCTIRVRGPSSRGRGEFRLSDLLNSVRKTGLFDSTQLGKLEFEVVLENERRQPVPCGLLLLKDSTQVDTLLADSTGRLTLRLTPDLIYRDPEIVATKDGILLTTTARLFATFEFDTNERWRTIDVTNYQRRFNDGVVVLYCKAPEVMVDSVLHLLTEQRRYIKENLPLEPIGWGVVLVDSPPPFSLVQTHIRGDAEEFQLFPYWVSEWREGLYRDNFYRLTKNCLFRTLPYLSEKSAVWLFGGLPGYWSYEYFRSVLSTAGKVRAGDATILPKLRPLMFNNREWANLESLLSINSDSVLDLLNWTPSGASDWFLALNCSRAFWKVVHDAYGPQAVAQFLAAAGGIQNLSTEQLVELLAVKTGPDVKRLLRSFPKFRALRVLSVMHQEIDLMIGQ